MAVLTVVNAGLTGVQVDNGSAASAGGDSFANTGYELLVVRNGAAAPINVTATAVSGSNAVAAVANATTVVIGPFPPARFNSAGAVSITYSASATVFVKVVRAYVPDCESSF